MSYKISDKAIIIESDGKAILVAEEAEYITSLSVGSTVQDLDEGYFTDYFYKFQGSTSGYVSGGYPPSFSQSDTNVIQKFPFATDTNASDVGDLTQARGDGAGQSSDNNGYTSGGYDGSYRNTIDKFPFSSDDNASDVGDLTGTRASLAGHSTGTNGYTSGGMIGPSSSGTYYNIIDKFPFSSDANATDAGDINFTRGRVGGQSSSTHGYTSGGATDLPPFSNIFNTIDKFPFAIDGGTGTDVGDLSQARYITSGQSSLTHGYNSGGFAPPNINTIDKFSFSTDANATDVGNLTRSGLGSGQSSTQSGYTSGGPPTQNTIIDKFPFSTDANATDVGDLVEAHSSGTGQQI